MKTYAMTGTALAALLALSTQPLAGQQPWAAEGRLNVDVPTQQMAGEDLGTGFGFGGTVHYRFLPHLGVYAGWDWAHFNPDNSFAGADVDLEETGYSFGLRFEHPFSGEEGGTAWWGRAGGTYAHLEFENQDGDLIVDSGHGLGWEVAGGIAYGFRPAWVLNPGVRFRSLSRDVTIGNTTRSVDLSYLAFEVGIARRF